MAEGRIAVDFDTLSAHAGRVERVADDLGLAKGAAASTDIGGGAFGLMCAFMVPPVSLVATMARNAIGSATGMVERSAAAIREVATEFESFEETARLEFEGIQENELGVPR